MTLSIHTWCECNSSAPGLAAEPGSGGRSILSVRAD